MPNAECRMPKAKGEGRKRMSNAFAFGIRHSAFGILLASQPY